MIDLQKSQREFYKSQSKEQLIIFLLNGEYEKKRLRKKLRMLTGCGCYGDSDGMNGSCIECYYDNPMLQMKCSQFQDEFTKMLTEEANKHMK